MPKYLLVLLILFSAHILYAQPDTAKFEGWRKGGVGMLNMTQVGLSNWAAGGQNSLSVLGVANLFAHYKRGNNSWTNTLDFTYGLQKAGKDKIRKNDDRLDLLAKYGHNASTDWYYSALLNFRSQLTPTYSLEDNQLISTFLAPAFILGSLGMDYKPTDNFSLFLSPVTGKFTLVRAQQLADIGAFGVKPAQRDAAGRIIPGTGERFREEFGAYLNARYRLPIAENITYQTKLDLFSNYLKKPGNIDVNWENLINMKVNKFISASIFTHLIYDDDIEIKIDEDGDGEAEASGPRVQFKESIGVGLSYKF